MKDLASHIMDIVQNSIRAEANQIEILIYEAPGSKDDFTIEIRDNGHGMDASTLQRVRDPFFTSRTERKVGLGIPLLQQNAERTGGYVTIDSAPGKGTTICARFAHSHMDRPPLGDMAGTISLLIAANPSIDFIYTHTRPEGSYRLDTEELKQILNGVSLNHPDIFPAVREMIRENLKEINADQNHIQLNKQSST